MEKTAETVDSVWLSKDLKPFKQGAEAYLYRCAYFGRKAVIKERFAKTYRHPSLDLILTKERVKAELNALLKCKTMGIDVPTVYFVNIDRNSFIMEEIPSGTTARQFLEDLKNSRNFEEIITDFGIRLGQIIAKLHFSGITHGDLTTSNVLLRNGNPKTIVFIDFGLAEGNATVESKGVDLYVLERAVSSTHAEAEFFFGSIMKGYELFNRKQCDAVNKKLKEIERRGRKHEMLG
ncbi:BUD32 protein kinase [Loa loa]|uniref:non-specific serine/threonine protein kinase n=1 Tax=Loa loa TaxID=7209 RepID=A0A1I7W036_LOALO|nr:BUD32 protein kinase [Loa loa]EFO19301.1 BUD32 protein kinase [Loa loa]